MDEHDEIFQEPSHPEVTEGEFEPASEDTIQDLFELVEAKAKSGFTEDIGADDPAHVLQMSLPDGGKLELWWDPDLPADEDFPVEKGGGRVTKTTYYKDASGKIKAEETIYHLLFAPDGPEISKEVGEGVAPDEEKELQRLVADAQEQAPLTPERTSIAAEAAHAKIQEAESTDSFIANKQAELEIGLPSVSENEVRDLARLIQSGTPLK